MKVKDLVQVLKGFDQEKEVWCANDEEGNQIHESVSVHITQGLFEAQPSRTVVVIYPINGENDIF